jgi:DNA-binding SARP family transcriptional activator
VNGDRFITRGFSIARSEAAMSIGTYDTLVRPRRNLASDTWSRPGAGMRYGLLGPLSVFDGAHELSPGAPRDRALLALLLLHRGTTVGVDRMVDCMWGEAPPPSARHSIQTMVWRLRRVLGEDEIVNSGPGYLMPDPAVDVDEVAALVTEGRMRLPSDPDLSCSLFEAALMLWRGEPLLDVAYADWAQPEIRRLDELRAALVIDRLAALVALGRHAEAIPELEAFVTADPHHERAWGLLIVALSRSGRSGAALGCYRRAERLLVEELGLSPSQALQRLEYLVLTEDPDLQGAWAEECVRNRTAPGFQALDE